MADRGLSICQLSQQQKVSRILFYNAHRKQHNNLGEKKLHNTLSIYTAKATRGPNTYILFCKNIFYKNVMIEAEISRRTLSIYLIFTKSVANTTFRDFLQITGHSKIKIALGWR